jgi:hypothetical protein
MKTAAVNRQKSTKKNVRNEYLGLQQDCHWTSAGVQLTEILNGS